MKKSPYEIELREINSRFEFDLETIDLIEWNVFDLLRMIFCNPSTLIKTKLFLSQNFMKSNCCSSEQINPNGKLGLIAIIALII